MNFPSVVTVKVQDALQKPIENVAVILKLFAPRKNNYYVGPLVTDQNGTVQFTRELCERAIAKSKEMFLMDYVGTLETCRPELTVALHPPNQLATMLKNLKEAPNFWGSPFEDVPAVIDSLSRARNESFKAGTLHVTEDEVQTQPHLVLTASQTIS